MTPETGEFIFRFLIHVLPKGFHLTRHYGLFASNVRAGNLAAMRALIVPSSLLPQANAAPKPETAGEPAERCPKCGGRMLIVERFEGTCRPRTMSFRPTGDDTSRSAPRRFPAHHGRLELPFKDLQRRRLS
jgi:Putative transposase